MPSSTPVIYFNNLRKNYGSLEVLRGMNASIYKGDVVSIIGTSGCGKSTLLRCCNRLETISGGKLKVIDIDLSQPNISSQKLRQLRTKVGMVFQQFNLFPHLSVLVEEEGDAKEVLTNPQCDRLKAFLSRINN